MPTVSLTKTEVAYEFGEQNSREMEVHLAFCSSLSFLISHSDSQIVIVRMRNFVTKHFLDILSQ